MPKPVVVMGDVVTFLPTAGAAVVTAAPTVVLVTSGSELNATFMDAMVESDLTNIDLGGTYPALYIKGGYLGGTGMIKIDSWPDYSSVCTKGGDAVAINTGAQGDYTMTMVVPAILPGTPPTPDTGPSYSGKFTITTTQLVLNA